MTASATSAGPTLPSPPYTLRKAAAMPRFERSVSLLGWAYNEEALIADYLCRAHAMLEQACEDFEIVLIDDGSTDRTNEIVRGLQKDLPRVRLLRNETNRNVGYSFRRAVTEARKEFLFWQTVDWSYDISFLRIHLELLKHYDVVAGVRRSPVEVADRLAFTKPLLGVLKHLGVRHITRRSDTVRKALVSVCNYGLIRTLFNVPVGDYQNVVYYPTALIQSFTYEADSSFVNPEGLIKTYHSGASIVEVPISFLPRQAGRAKGARPRAIGASLKDILRLWWKLQVLRDWPYRKIGSVRRLVPAEWDIPDIA